MQIRLKIDSYKQYERELKPNRTRGFSSVGNRLAAAMCWRQAAERRGRGVLITGSAQAEHFVLSLFQSPARFLVSKRRPVLYAETPQAPPWSLIRPLPHRFPLPPPSSPIIRMACPPGNITEQRPLYRRRARRFGPRSRSWQGPLVRRFDRSQRPAAGSAPAAGDICYDKAVRSTGGFRRPLRSFVRKNTYINKVRMSQIYI